MILVFYCYSVRMGKGLPPFTEDCGPMFFKSPPRQGDEVVLRLSKMPAIIQKVDHYLMVIHVTPVKEISVVAL
jgi:hypothetical protein